MRKIATVVFAALSVSACQMPQSGGSQASAAPATQGTAKIAQVAKEPDRPAAFQVRDFTLSEDKSQYGTVTVQGRGTLVTRDPRVENGNYVVWLTAKREQSNGNPWTTQVLVRDGVGTFTTFDLPDKNEKVKYSDWQVIGFVPLQRGEIERASDALPKSS